MGSEFKPATAIEQEQLLLDMLFPDEPDAWPDYDDYYMRINRIVIGGMLAINGAVTAYALALEARGIRIVEAEERYPIGDAALLLALPALIALFFVKSKRANLALLVLLNGLVLIEAAAGAL